MFGDTYYSDSQVQVTDEWIKLKDKAYPVSAIKSAKLAKLYSDPLVVWSRPLKWSGALFLLASFGAYFIASARAADLTLLIGALALLGVQNFIIGYLIGESRQPDYTYVLALRGRFGKANALVSKDESYIQDVLQAILEVMRMYR